MRVFTYGEQRELLWTQEFAEQRAKSLEAQGREAAQAGDWKRACEFSEQANEALVKALLAQEILASMALQKFREERAAEAAETTAPVLHAPTSLVEYRRSRERSCRPRERRATRSSAKSGDSPSDPEPPSFGPLPEAWRWRQPPVWGLKGFIRSVQSGDVEKQLARERNAGVGR